MNKLIQGFALAFFLLSIVSAVFDGFNSMASTTLAAPMSTTQNTASVVSVTGFLPGGGYLFIENEKVSYTGINAGLNQFTGVSRGVESTKAATHRSGKAVYNEDAGVLNTAIGFNPAALAASNGFFSVVMIPYDFFTITLPKLVTWDFSFFAGDLQLIRIALMIISIGLYVTFAIQLGFAISNIIKR